MLKIGKEPVKPEAKEAKEERELETLKKKEKFRAFLKAMGMSKENKQSWNDNFQAFMADDGLGLQHTNDLEKEKKKKREKKEEDKKEKTDKKAAKTEEKEKEVVQAEPEKDSNIDEQRLYVMNLPFTITHEEMRELFQKFGTIQDIEVPVRKAGVGFGFAFVRFESIESTVSAFASLDKTYF